MFCYADWHQSARTYWRKRSHLNTSLPLSESCLVARGVARFINAKLKEWITRHQPPPLTWRLLVRWQRTGCRQNCQPLRINPRNAFTPVDRISVCPTAVDTALTWHIPLWHSRTTAQVVSYREAWRRPTSTLWRWGRISKTLVVNCSQIWHTETNDNSVNLPSLVAYPYPLRVLFRTLIWRPWRVNHYHDTVQALRKWCPLSGSDHISVHLYHLSSQFQGHPIYVYVYI